MRHLLPLSLISLLACTDPDDTGTPGGQSMTPTMQQITISAGESKAVYVGYSWQVTACYDAGDYEECRDESDNWLARDGWLCLQGTEICGIDLSTATGSGYYVVTVLL